MWFFAQSNVWNNDEITLNATVRHMKKLLHLKNPWSQALVACYVYISNMLQDIG